MASTLLDMAGMKDSYFGGAAMIGISSALPGHRFCWLLNQHFETNFASQPESTICMAEAKSGKKTVKYLGTSPQASIFDEMPEPDGELFYFPTYCHTFPNTVYNYVLYQLKCGNACLLPEVKHLDYLWLLQTAEPHHDAHIVLAELRNLTEVQLAQELTTEQLKKNMSNLLM